MFVLFDKVHLYIQKPQFLSPSWDTHEKPLGHCSVHSFRVVLLPYFSECKPETVSKDCWHLVEAIGSAIWVLSQWNLYRQSMENYKHLRFSPAISVLLYSQTLLLTGSETLECFPSKSTNYMHILASGPEQQAVYFGHAFHPEVKIVPPTLVRFKPYTPQSWDLRKSGQNKGIA
jgi:hypothetical protein